MAIRPKLTSSTLLALADDRLKNKKPSPLLQVRATVLKASPAANGMRTDCHDPMPSVRWSVLSHLVGVQNGETRRVARNVPKMKGVE